MHGSTHIASELQCLRIPHLLPSSIVNGLDNIGPKVLNSCADSLTASLHYLFSLSLVKGVVPSVWKCHNIIPTFKSGDKSNFKN